MYGLIETIIFISIIYLHLAKKKSHSISAYVVQSCAVASLLLIRSIEYASWELAAIAIVMAVVKCVGTPYMFLRYTQKTANLMSTTYLNVPFTLIVLVLIIAFCGSDIVAPLAAVLPEIPQLPMMLVSTILVSIWLLIDRKDSFSQVFGVLSLENSIVTWSFFLGITQSFIVEAALVFDIGVWVLIGIVFIKLLYETHGVIDVTELSELKS